MKKLALSILTMAFILLSGNAQQFPVDEQYQSTPPPATPAMPDYGQSVIDNSVTTPIEITRVTEYYAAWDWYPTHEYAKTQVWNADQSMYKIASWKVYNASDYTEIHELSSMYPAYWSNTNPDLIWSFRENGDIKKHFVSTNTTQTVATITKSDGSAYEYVMLGPGEGNIDKNDHYVAFACKDGLDLDVVIFDLINLQVVTLKKMVNCWGNGNRNFPDYVDWVSVSQSGDYVVIMFNNPLGVTNHYIDQNGTNHYGVEVYSALDLQYQNRIIHYGNHGDLGYAVDGDEVLVQFYGEYGNGHLYMHKLNGSQSSIVLSTSLNFEGEGHVSCRNINRPGWAYVTIEQAAKSGELLAIKLDNRGIVEHFGHHFSSAISYDQSPMAVASPNGDIVCFKSDFGTSPNDGNMVYNFFAKISNPLSVDEDVLTGVNIFPNPAYDYIKIESKININNLTIYNVSGQKIKDFQVVNANVNTINLNNFDAGFYYLEMITETNKYTKKIIIR